MTDAKSPTPTLRTRAHTPMPRCALSVTLQHAMDLLAAPVDEVVDAALGALAAFLRRGHGGSHRLGRDHPLRSRLVAMSRMWKHPLHKSVGAEGGGQGIGGPGGGCRMVWLAAGGWGVGNQRIQGGQRGLGTPRPRLPTRLWTF